MVAQLCFQVKLHNITEPNAEYAVRTLFWLLISTYLSSIWIVLKQDEH